MAANSGLGAAFEFGSPRVERLRDRHRRTTACTLVGAVVAALVIFAVATAALASVPPKRLTDLHKGHAFGRGATFTMISQGAAGGGFDLTCQAIALYVAPGAATRVGAFSSGALCGAARS